ncbi:MAG: enoyl-CoA hydratase/isomerase family protein [Ktedonobacteraceae bacterium]|nr:enoyl-CoA hydratase/isomerase family protein [Ktedonobacteraceae bacterium]
MPDIRVRRHKDILWLILDRQPLNLLTPIMLDQLAKALRDAVEHPPRLVVITGMGEQAFCAGLDLPGETEASRARILLAAKEVEGALDALHARRIPSVAIVKGSAYDAGCELAALCEVVIAREDALFRLSAAQARIFSRQQAGQVGETLSAHEALRLDLVHQVIPRRRFLADTEELLAVLASGVSF